MTRSITTRASSLLKVAEITNRVVLNFWSPGYTIKESIVCFDGKSRVVKNFFSTSTQQAASIYLIQKYGSDNYLKFKEDIHPGHCSVQTKSGNYLSIGTDEGLENIGITSQHEVVYGESFEQDVIAMKRFPEKRLDFYTLNIMKINELIETLRKPDSVLYSLLGSRPGIKLETENNESCATISYRCLAIGGLEELLPLWDRSISSRTVLTPSLLTDYAEIARLIETERHLNIKDFQKEFETKSKILSEQFDEKIKIIKEKEAPETIGTSNYQNKGIKPKP